MAAQITALLVFTGVFVLATLRKVHLGVIMIATAAAVGLWLGNMGLPEVLSGFPVSILVLLVGVTYFFGIAQANGTIDRLIHGAIRIVGNRASVLPLAFFFLTGGVSAMGSPIAGLVMAPIGMPLAKQYGVDRMLMGLAIGSGLSAGAFAPTSLFGIVTYGTAHSVDIPLDPMLLFGIAVAVNLLLLAFAYVLFGGFRSARRRAVGARNGGSPTSFPEQSGFDAGPEAPVTASNSAQRSPSGTGTLTAERVAVPQLAEKFTAMQRLTVLCILGLIASVVALSVLDLSPDIGVLCLSFATLLTILDPNTGKTAVGKVDWSTVLMVGGIITFVGVLETMGAVTLLGEAASRIGSPLVAAFILCLMGGLISAFASTTGILAALVPLAIPLVSSGDIAGWAVIAALGVCSSIVDVSPFSTAGATLVASVDEAERPRMNQLLMRWGLSMVVVGPALLIGLLVLPFSL